METWFISALLGAVLAGLSNFMFKVAAKKNFNSEVFSMYGGCASVIVVALIGIFLENNFFQINLLTTIMFIGGVIASTGGILKVYALRHIDSTIYFPLFKLLSPALAVVFGMVLFAERFSPLEWFGIVLGLTVPLLLITRSENHRQSNLKAGLVLVVVTAGLSAVAAVMSKYATDMGVDILTGLLYASLGVLVGTISVIIYKQSIASLFKHIQKDTNLEMLMYASSRALLITSSYAFALHAYKEGGTLGIVQTIHSMYILIPIVLAIVVYKEHWNLQKAVAIILSVAALALLG